jgi:ATP-binding cassette subfamily F protein uup
LNLLSVENLSKQFGEKKLFSGIGFGVEHGQRVALVAANGAGKSTLLKILSGREIADDGSVTFRSGIRVSFLEQEPEFNLSDTVYNALFHSENKMLLAVRDYEIAVEKNETEPTPAHHKEMEEAMARVDALNAWNYEVNVKQILSRLNIHHLDQPLHSLSGGELKRVALARVLIEEPQLLIMDEPTNHLDLDMIEWLENYFVRHNVTLFIVTHDRYFLDNVCTVILELENGKLYSYKGNYQYFIEKKAEREFNEAQELGKAKSLFNKELEWMRKMPSARRTKSKARIEDFHELKEKISGKRKKEELQLNVKMNRIGGKVIEMKKVYKSYGDKVMLKGFDYTFNRGERIGIVGKNGIGKTTFLNIMCGLEKADSGKVNVGDTIVFGYYSQKGLRLKEDKRVIEVVKDIAENIPMADGSKVPASQFLQMFRFPPEMQFTPVSKLSGGEKKRLYLLTVLVKNPNFLILDEPTNDLDLITLSTLEEFLESFTGCLVIVSHDRYFMDKLADHLFIFEGDGVVRDFNGNYSEYREEEKKKEKEEQRESRKEKESGVQYGEKKIKPKPTYKEKFEYEKLEKELAELEKRKTELMELLESGITEHEKLFRLSSEMTDVSKQIDEKFLRWMELGEKMETD